MLLRHAGFFAACLIGCSSASSAPTPQTNEDAAVTDASPDLDAAVDAPSTDEASVDAGAGAWGEPCKVGNATACAAGLFCLQGPNGGATGFCTKTCPSTSSKQCPGTPTGTAAFCVVTDVDTQGDKGCAFMCSAGSKTWTCPGVLKCQTADDPPGSGQRLCIP